MNDVGHGSDDCRAEDWSRLDPRGSSERVKQKDLWNRRLCALMDVRLSSGHPSKASKVVYRVEFVDVAVRRRESLYEVDMHVENTCLVFSEFSQWDFGMPMNLYFLALEVRARALMHVVLYVEPHKTFGH